MTTSELVAQVLERSGSDAVFRATALHDPVAALAQVARENGLTIQGDEAESVAFVRAPEDPAPADPAPADRETARAVYVLPAPPPHPF